MIANTIDPSIVMTSEVPSDHPELGNKLPVLDTQMSMEEGDEEGEEIRFMFYEKPMSSKVILQKNSAMSARMKMTSHVQDGVRRLKNTYVELSKEIKDEILSNYMQKFKNRLNILKAVLKAFKTMLRRDETGEKPLYWDQKWMREERDNEKVVKRLNWYKARPGGEGSTLRS